MDLKGKMVAVRAVRAVLAIVFWWSQTKMVIVRVVKVRW